MPPPKNSPTIWWYFGKSAFSFEDSTVELEDIQFCGSTFCHVFGWELNFKSQCLDTPDPSEVPKNKRYETTSSRQMETTLEKLYSWMMWKTIMLGSQLPWSIYIVPCTLRHVLFHASFLTDLTFLVFFGCKVNHCSKSKRPKVPKRLWKLLHEIRCGSKDGKGMRSSCFRTTCFFTKEPIIEAEWTSHIFQLMMIFCSAQLPDEQRTACRWNWIACISGHLIHW